MGSSGLELTKLLVVYRKDQPHTHTHSPSRKQPAPVQPDDTPVTISNLYKHADSCARALPAQRTLSHLQLLGQTDRSRER